MSTTRERLEAKYGPNRPLCGFDLPEGWLPLVDKLIADLMQHGFRVAQIEQVKEARK